GSHATTRDDVSALVHLSNGTNNPVNGSFSIELRRPLARALGFSADAPLGKPDSTITLNIAIMNLSPASYDPNKYSLFGAVCHEIDEALGVASALTGLSNGDAPPTGAISPEDLFRYDQSGARSFTTDSNAVSYFSTDGFAFL